MVWAETHDPEVRWVAMYLNDIAPIPPEWVVEKWFSPYFAEGDFPEGATGFGVVLDPRTGYKTVEIMVDPDYDLDEFKERFALWLRTPPKSGRFPGVPMSGVVVGHVTLSWANPELYRFIHARPVLHRVLNGLGQVQMEIPCYSIQGEGKLRSPKAWDEPWSPGGPPFYVEFAGPKTKGRCRKAGPFRTQGDAIAHAAKHAGFKHAPRDGWFQVFDSHGQITIIT